MDFKNRARFLKHEDPKVWSLTNLDSVGNVYVTWSDKKGLTYRPFTNAEIRRFEVFIMW